MKHCIALVFSCLVGSGIALPLRAQEGKLPAPPPLEQEESLKLIKQIFKSEYSKRTTAARRDLSKVLLSKAKREKNDMVAKFVLLSEAMNFSAKSGEFGNALEAFRIMDEGYLIDPIKVKEDLLTAFPRTKSLIAEETVFDEWMELVDKAILVDDYSDADRLVGLARKRVSRDKLLLGIAKEKSKYIKLLEKRFEEIKPAFLKLADDPENAEANGTTGEFFSLYKRAWKTGLPLVAKGPEGDLKKLADEEFKAPSVSLELQGVADGWWKMAQGNKDLIRISCLMRAAYWYRKALVGLEGLSQVRIEKKLTEIEKEIGVTRGVKLSELQVLCYQDRRWHRHPLEKITLARRGEALVAKNTSGIWRYVLLSSKRLLRGDFSVTASVYGGRAIGITSEDLRSKRLEVDLKGGWQRVRIERVGKSVTFTVNGKPVKWKPGEYQSYYGEVDPDQTAYFFISMNAGQQSSIQSIEIETATKEFGTGDPPDDDDDDDDNDRDRGEEGRDRGRDDGRGRPGGGSRGRGGRN